MQPPPGYPGNGRKELQPGQSVTIPSATPGYEARHTVSAGETWQSLAQRWSVDENALRQANTSDEDSPADDSSSEEGLGSFVEGAVKGDFADNDSWSAAAGQIAVGFIPIVGQIADLRDTAAAVKKVWNGEEGGWLALGSAAVGWVPGIGDAAKVAMRGGGKVADASAQASQQVLRQGDEMAQGAAKKAQAYTPGTRRLPGETPADAAQRLDADIAHARAHNGNPDDIAQWERHRADNLADVRKEAEQLDGAVPGRLLPNHSYQLNGYTYTTDAQGRIKTVEGQLRLEAAPRSSSAQASVGQGDGRLAVDQGGHLIGAQFGGYRGVENLTPMHQSINDYHKGAWGSMEKQWAAALREGKTVQVKIELKYDNDTIRAAEFVVAENIDGQFKRNKI